MAGGGAGSRRRSSRSTRSTKASPASALTRGSGWDSPTQPSSAPWRADFGTGASDDVLATIVSAGPAVLKLYNDSTFTGGPVDNQGSIYWVYITINVPMDLGAQQCRGVRITYTVDSPMP